MSVKKLKLTRSDSYRKIIHSFIPGGAHTYSKGDDQFPLASPAAITRGKGAYVWDPDGNKYLDCSMGLSSVSLGHAYEPVLKRVRKELEKGVNFQRPAIIEMEMAKKFLSLVPGHERIKFGKNGSLVVTAAVKLARAFTNRKLVAFPSDHPFYSYDDWFIGKTECSRGVPEEISALSVTFKGYDLRSLDELFRKYPGQIACVVTEPERGGSAHGNFLKDAIELAHKNGSLFVIDEMITGFKTAFPGSIKKFKVSPDLATWGKGIANGFSFCALTGKKEVMDLGGIKNENSEKVFLISTTHGSETHAIAAGLATIAEFEKHDVIGHNHGIGKMIIDNMNELIHSRKLNDHLSVNECIWFPAITFRDGDRKESAGMRTLFMQEMIRNKVLFQGSFVPCFSHNKREVDLFCKAFMNSAAVYEKALIQGYRKFLKGEPVKPVFRKYN